MPAARLRPARTIEGRRLTDLMGEAWATSSWSSRRSVGTRSTDDGSRAGSWPAPGTAAGQPDSRSCVEIHGGPQTLYGWSLMWEWQCLVAEGMSVYACNPRGSQGYGQDFAAANFGDWGTGPMADVMGGIDALVADGLVDPDRLGVTGGSYGGYLTSWIVGHTDRFRAAITCRSVNDMTSQMETGDIAGPQFGRARVRRESVAGSRALLPRVTAHVCPEHPHAAPHPALGEGPPARRSARPSSSSRCSASLKRPVRLMRVPDETHELTRSGTPFRRVDNLILIRDWFRHYLVDGAMRLPRVRPPRRD